MASLSRRIAAWSASAEAYAIIDRHELGATWFSGGCPAFAVAAARWAGHPGSVVAVSSGASGDGWRADTAELRRAGGVAEHYVAEAGGWLIDADGACPPAVMLRRWREREGIRRPALVRVWSMDREMESQSADYVCPAAAVSEIESALRAALGQPDAYELDVPPRFATTSATVAGLYDAVRAACVSRQREVTATLRALREAAASAEAAGATAGIRGYDAVEALFDAIEREPVGTLEGDRDEAYDAVHALFSAQMKKVKAGLPGFPYPSLDPAELAQRFREPIASAYAGTYAAMWLLWGAYALAAAAWHTDRGGCGYAAHMAAVVIATCSKETRRDAEARVVSAVLAGLNAPTRRQNPPRQKLPNLFVSLRPDRSSAARIAADRGVDAEGLHVTLAFLGRLDGLGPSAAERAARACARAASGAGAIRAQAGRAERFPDAGGMRVSYLPVRGAGLSSLRARVVRELEAEGLPVNRTYGFVPHITIGVSPSGHRPPPAGEPVALSFAAVWVCVGHDMKIAARLRGGTDDHRTRRRR